MSTEFDEAIFDRLLEIRESDVARVSESEFKRVLLPMFLQNDQSQADLRLWLKIAGSWQRPVDVYEDNDSSNILFRVPALMGSVATPGEHTASNSAYEVIRTAQRKMNVSSRGGDEYLINGLAPKLRIEDRRKDNIEAWNTIFRRYGLDQFVIDTTEMPDEPGERRVDGDNPDPISGYDEL